MNVTTTEDMADINNNARACSDSPGDIPTACLLEWNFMASRINSVLSMMRAHHEFKVVLNLQKVADGMSIKRVRRRSIPCQRLKLMQHIDRHIQH